MANSIRLVLFALAAILYTSGHVQADAVAEFYKGKTLQFIIGYPPGGGYDTYSRLLVKTLRKHIPGNPAIVIMNMPGAASLKAAQYLARANGDGLTIGMFNRGLLPKSRLEPEEVKVDFSQFTWIGSMNNDVAVCITWGATGIKNISDLKKGKIVLADTGENSGAYLYTSLLHSLFPENTRRILGYEGSNAIFLAMERGEVDAKCNTWEGLKTHRADWFKGNKAYVLVQFTNTKHPDLPHVPLISDFAPSEAHKRALTFLTASDAIARPIVGPPGMVPERARALQTAFEASMKDPELLAEAERTHVDLDFVGGEEARKIALEIAAAPPEVISTVRKLLKGE